MAEGFDYEAYRAMQSGVNLDKALLVSFEYVARKKKGYVADDESDYENVPFTRIWMDKNTEIFRETTEDDKIRFEDRWKSFLRGEEPPEEGTPIKMVPFATPANIAAAKAERIYTVEQLLATADGRLQRAYLVNFKYMCRDWMESKADVGHIQRMRDTITKLESQVAALTEQLQGAEEPAPAPAKKRGRPRKADGNTEGAGQ